MIRKIAFAAAVVAAVAVAGLDRARADGCKVCEAAGHIAEKMRCDGCKAAEKACDACAAEGKDAAKHAKEAGDCEKFCKPVAESGRCVDCDAKAKVADAAYCSEGCRTAKKACDKCAAVAEKALRVECKACPQSHEMKGVTVKAEKRGPMSGERGVWVKGFYSFHLTLSNSDKKDKKTVHGTIVLKDAEGKEVGKGTYYVELEPGQTTHKTINVKEEGTWKTYELVVKNVLAG